MVFFEKKKMDLLLFLLILSFHKIKNCLGCECMQDLLLVGLIL